MPLIHIHGLATSSSPYENGSHTELSRPTAALRFVTAAKISLYWAPEMIDV